MKSKILSSVSLSIAVLMVAFSSANVFADSNGDNDHDFNLETRVGQLERQVFEMNRALTILQKRVDDLSYYPPANTPAEAIAACMIVDSGYSKTFLGTAKTKLDAEYNARMACQNNVSAGFCTGISAHLKCDDNFKPPYASGYVCMITDSGYSKIYRGTGRTAVEAEAKAKQSCQSAVSAGFCGKVEARCEAQQ